MVDSSNTAVQFTTSFVDGRMVIIIIIIAAPEKFLGIKYRSYRQKLEVEVSLLKSSRVDCEAKKPVTRTPWKYAFLPCCHLDFESAVTVQNGEFKGIFHGSHSRLLNVKPRPRNSILSHDTFRYVR